MAERKAYLLRIAPEVWEQVERLAQQELRSVNGQVEYLLREALAKRGFSTDGTARRAGRARRDG